MSRISKDRIIEHFDGDWLPAYEHFVDVKKTGAQSLARCPFHDDKDPSLSIERETGRFNCFGCGAAGDFFTFYARRKGLDTNGRFGIVLDEIGREFGISGADEPRKSKGRGEIRERYDYTDENGDVLFQVCRMEPKSFRQRRPDGKDGWTWSVKGVRQVPFNLPAVLKAEEVLIVEGEKDVGTARKLSFTATCNAGGAGKWKHEFSDFLAGKDVILIPDNDDPGRDHMKRVAASLEGKARSVKWLDLPDLPDKGDLSDWAQTFDDEAAAAERMAIMIESAPDWAEVDDPCEIELISAADLGAMEFKEPAWVVPDILPAGLAILAGKPKIGKSWLSLNIALALGMGGRVLDRVIEQESAIYFGLEDPPRRLQKRLCLMAQGKPLPKKLLCSTALPRLHEGGLDVLERTIRKRKPLLVVIDTLARFRPPPKRSDGYQSDTDLMSSSKHLADTYGCCILVVHHLRKGSGEDPLDEISGTTGIAGAADSILILKRMRGGKDAELLATGRDFDEVSLAVRFYPDLGAWGLLGDARQVALSKERQEILEILRVNGPMTPAQIATEIGKKRGAVRMLLIRMAEDRLIFSSDGKYEEFR